MDKARGDRFAAAAPDEIIQLRTQSFRLAEFGCRGMSFKICRGTLGSLASLHRLVAFVAAIGGLAAAPTCCSRGRN
jgi:hypothetical protein